MTGRKREHVLRVTIKDCKVSTFRAGGPGGQNQNKRDTGVRVIHAPSGAVGESRSARGQLENKRLAFRKMAETQTFKAWVRMRVAGKPSFDELVDEMMAPDNLVIEVKQDGKWVHQT